MTIGLIIAAVFLFCGRIALEGLAEKYQFLGQWLTVVTIALVVVTAVLSIAVFRWILEQLVGIKNLILPGREAQQGQDQVIARKKSRERESTRAERREQREARKERRKDLRDKIRRVTAYEKRRTSKKKGNNRHAHADQTRAGSPNR